MRSLIDVGAVIAEYDQLNNFTLRDEWRRLYQTPPPRRLSRELMIRGIAYKMQEVALGGLSTSLVRKLVNGSGETNSGSTASQKTKVKLKPGTRLVREWRGVTHSVLVHADGIEWNGHRFKSLTLVAREITGAHWSGPRFFGLKSTRGSADAKGTR